MQGWVGFLYYNMDTKIIGSSSAGNAIEISDGSTSLLVDCGVQYSKLLKEIDVTSLGGVFLSHSHQDHLHMPTLKNLFAQGIDFYCSRGTSASLAEAIPNFYYNRLKALKHTRIGSWSLTPFDLKHDAAEPLGLHLRSAMTGEEAVYLVDSGEIPRGLEPDKVNYWLIEANYAKSLLGSGDYSTHLKERVKDAHLSIGQVHELFDNMDTSAIEKIYLLHLSDANSDAGEFRKKIMGAAGVPVQVAAK